jgi:hypothetical protein
LYGGIASCLAPLAISDLDDFGIGYVKAGSSAGAMNILGIFVTLALSVITGCVAGQIVSLSVFQPVHNLSVDDEHIHEFSELYTHPDPKAYDLVQQQAPAQDEVAEAFNLGTSDKL